MKKLILITLLLSASCAANRYAVRYEAPPAPRITAQVIEILDGDTVVVVTLNANDFTVGNDRVTPFCTNSIRMLFIDAPESSPNVKLERNMLQYFAKGAYVKKERVIELGKEAKKHLAKVIKPSDRVELEFPSSLTDLYGRFLAVVFHGNTNLNYLMVRDGYASPYFLGETASSALKYYRKTFLRAGETAKAERLGVWKELNGPL
jgi:endonuclease YncB( thermonuclease family)